jgi:hypothetical protein
MRKENAAKNQVGNDDTIEEDDNEDNIWDANIYNI